MVRQWVRSKRLLMVVLAVVGVFNVALVLRPFEPETIEPVPMSAAVAAPTEATPVGLRSYIGLVKAQAAGVDVRDQVHAAVMFTSYFLLSTRGIAAECQAAGHDFSAVASAFAAAHRREYDQASRVLAGYGLNSEVVWSFFAGDIARLATEHVNQYARRLDGKPATACSKLAGLPQAFAIARRFESNYPDLHGRLMR
jgi:hypothetical protein